MANSAKSAGGSLWIVRKTVGNRHTLADGYHDKRNADWWDEGSPAHRYLAAIREGVPRRLAAHAAGVADSAVLKWRSLADSIDPEVAKYTVAQQMHVRFFRSVADAEADLALELVSAWKAEARTDWRAAKELLARRFPEDLGDPASRVELSGPGGGPVTVADPNLSDVLEAARARAIAEAE